MGQVKHLYCGIFNYPHKVFTLYCYAFSLAQAKEIMFRRLARKDGVDICMVRGFFSERRDNFKIETETFYSEIKEELSDEEKQADNGSSRKIS